MRYGSICSGIEAASVAWEPLGWRPSFFSEIEAFPRSVLSHHFPGVPLHGDFTTIRFGDYEPINLLVGGTPCQSFSLAGLRGGLGDDRGNLALEYLRLADRLRPRWLVWENVPGVLSSNGGRDFGAILGGMAELGYGFAYRVLDAQHVRVDGLERAVPQRRRRVFAVGYFGDWRRAAAVLFERASLSGHPPPRREAGKGIAEGAGGGVAGSLCANAHGAYSGQDAHQNQVIAFPWEMGGSINMPVDCDGSVGTLIKSQSYAVAFNLRGRDDGAQPELAEDGLSPAITAASGGSTRPYVAFGLELGNQGSGGNVGWFPPDAPCRTLDRGAPPGVAQGGRVRRLTPRECERLQGFPDDYTAVPHRGRMAADGPRYKALGNSMAVNVMRWIGQRIAMVDAL